MRLKWGAWPERAWDPWSAGGGCPGPFGLGSWEAWLWPSPKLRKHGSVDGLQSVSFGISVTDQEAAAGRSPNGVLPTAQQRHQHRLCLRDWLHRVFLQQPQWSCAVPAKAARLEDLGTASVHLWFKQCFIPCKSQGRARFNMCIRSLSLRELTTRQLCY